MYCVNRLSLLTAQKTEIDSLKQEIKNSQEKVSELETELTTLQRTFSSNAGEKVNTNNPSCMKVSSTVIDVFSLYINHHKFSF